MKALAAIFILLLAGVVAFVIFMAAASDPARAAEAVGVGGSVTAYSGIQYTDTTTPLVGSTTYTGVARDDGVVPGGKIPFGYFNAFFTSDQTGTASIECSNDSVTWLTCASSQLVAPTPLLLRVPVLFRYHRVKLINDANNETTLVINSSYTGS